MQRKEAYEQQQCYQPSPVPVKKVKLKRKRPMKPDPDNEKKAKEASAAEPAEPAVEPPPVTQVSQDIIPAPKPQVHVFDTRWQRGCKELQVVAGGLHDLGGCIQAVSSGGCTFRRLLSTGLIRRLHILAVAFKRCHQAVAQFCGCFQAVS